MTDMGSCCYPEEYGGFFDAREAARVVRRYLKRGLSGSAMDLAEGITSQGVTDKSVLEVGGGAGQILAELLRWGAGSGFSIDLSPQWDGAANELLERLDLGGRVERRTGDFVDAAPDLQPFGAVIMHRVVCCYPDWQAMLDAASSLQPDLMAMTVPRERATTKVFIGLSNTWLKLRGKSFRVFVHPHAPMLDRLAGYRVVFDRCRPIWRTVVLERTTVLNELG